MFYPAFRKDIIKYTGVISLFDKEYRIPLCEMCSELFNNAKEMRLMLPESNFELAFRFFEKTLLAMPSASCDEGWQAEAYSNAILTYLAGICTDEGRKRLNNIIVESHYENERKNV